MSVKAKQSAPLNPQFSHQALQSPELSAAEKVPSRHACAQGLSTGLRHTSVVAVAPLVHTRALTGESKGAIGIALEVLGTAGVGA